jgi:hypothetical protein
MRRKLAVAIVATILAAVLAAPVFAHHKLKGGSGIIARSGSGIVAAKF